MNENMMVNVNGAFVPVIEVSGQRVLTTAQLAECYGTNRKVISYNFNNNKDRYEEGKHYICISGDGKREFCNRLEIHDGSEKAQKLYLWTERGALLHAKSLNTDVAWQVYDALVDNYFTSARMVTITPSEAAKILAENNTNNRKVNQANVRKYADDMLMGKFSLNGDTIRFYDDGTLADGQHRLLACVLSGVPFQTYIVKGLKKDVLPTIDCGKPRNMVETLNMTGCNINKMLVPAMNLYFNKRASLTAGQAECLWNRYENKLAPLCVMLRGSHHDYILSQRDIRAFFIHLLVSENWSEDDVKSLISSLKPKPNCETTLDYSCYNFRHWYTKSVYNKLKENRKSGDKSRSYVTIEGLNVIADNFNGGNPSRVFRSRSVAKAKAILNTGYTLAQGCFKELETANVNRITAN